MHDKGQLRKTMLELRNSFDKEGLEKSSLSISEKVRQLEEYRQSSLIFCFMSFGSEVGTESLVKRSLAEGKRLAVPLVEKKGSLKSMYACEIKDPDSELFIRTFGIREPEPACAVRLDPKDVELVIVPGLAFDFSGNRVGYGAGFYDEFLQKTNKNCRKIGIAFDFQIVDGMQAEKHDIPVDIIVTEKRIIRI